MIDQKTTVSERYTSIAIWLHWLIAIMVIANVLLAIGTEDMSRATHKSAMAIHKSLGIIVLLLSFARIGWRLIHRPPPLPALTPTWQAIVSKAVHTLFYLLIVLLPVSGWVWMSAAGAKVDIFGLFQMPSLTGTDKALADAMHESHEFMGLTMLALIVIHVLAALKHQYLDKTDLLSRMNPWAR